MRLLNWSPTIKLTGINPKSHGSVRENIIALKIELLDNYDLAPLMAAARISGESDVLEQTLRHPETAAERGWFLCEAEIGNYSQHNVVALTYINFELAYHDIVYIQDPMSLGLRLSEPPWERQLVGRWNSCEVRMRPKYMDLLLYHNGRTERVAVDYNLPNT